MHYFGHLQESRMCIVYAFSIVGETYMSLVCGKVGRDDMDSYSPARSSLGIADILPTHPHIQWYYNRCCDILCMYTTMYELILALMEEIRVQTTDSSLIMFSTANDKVREVYSNSRLQWNVTMS